MNKVLLIILLFILPLSIYSQRTGPGGINNGFPDFGDKTNKVFKKSTQIILKQILNHPSDPTVNISLKSEENMYIAGISESSETKIVSNNVSYYDLYGIILYDSRYKPIIVDSDGNEYNANFEVQENETLISFKNIDILVGVKIISKDVDVNDKVVIGHLYDEMLNSNLFIGKEVNSIDLDEYTTPMVNGYYNVVDDEITIKSNLKNLEYVTFNYYKFDSPLSGIFIIKEPATLVSSVDRFYFNGRNSGLVKSYTTEEEYKSTRFGTIYDSYSPTFKISSSSTNKANGEWHQLKSLTIEAYDIDDNGGIGVSDFFWTKNGVPQGTGDSLPLREGSNTVYFTAIDFLGKSNSKPSGFGNGTFTIKLDKTPPSIHKPIFKGFSFDNNNLSAEFEWKASVDGPQNVTNSGFKGYFSDIISNYENQKPTYTNKKIEPISLTKTVDVSEGLDHLFYLYTEDNAGNKSSIKSYQLKVPNIPKFKSNDGIEASAEAVSYVPEYTMKLNFDLTDDQYDYNYKTAGAKYYLTRIYKDSNNNEVKENVKNEGISLIRENNNTYSFTDRFNGVKYKHKNIKYILTTKKIVGTKEYKIGESTSSENVANIQPSTNVVFIPGESPDKKPELKLSEAHSAVGFDVEGDVVKYILNYKRPRDDETVTNDFILLDRIADAQSFENEEDKIKSRYFKFAESGEYKFELISSDFEKLSDTNSYSSNHETPKTFSVIFDNIPPDINTFEVLGKHRESPPDGISDLGGSPTNNKNVVLSLQVTEDYSSPIEIKVDNTTYTLEQLKQRNFVTINNKDYKINIPYTLNDNSTETQIDIEVQDAAGNKSSTNKVVYLDKLAPVVSDESVIPFGIDNNDKYIKYSWKTSEIDLISYIGGTALKPNGKTEYLYKTDGYNKLHTATIDVVDRAGNKTTKYIDGCSRAELGTLESVTPGHDSENNVISPWIELEVKYDKVTASRVALDLFDINDNPYDRLEITNDGEKTFKLKNSNQILLCKITSTVNLNTVAKKIKIYGLPLHDDIKCKLVSMNKNDDEEVGGLETRTVENFKPDFGSDPNVYPKGGTYANLFGQIIWDKATDQNGDSIKYIVKVWDVNNSSKPVINESTFQNFYNLSGLNGSKSYKWSVTATDQNETFSNPSSLGPYSFKIDNSNPIIESDNLIKEPLFTNEKTVTFTVCDIEKANLNNSGISTVTTKINSNEEIITFKNESNEEEIKVTRDLPEGVVNISLDIEDKVGLEASKIYNLLVDRTAPTVEVNIDDIINNDSNYYYTPEKSIPVILKVKDDYSGLSHFEFYFTDSLEDTVPENKWKESKLNNFVPGTGDNKEYLITKNLNFPYDNGSVKYLRIRVHDYAGNLKNVKITKPILIDSSEPEFVNADKIFEKSNNEYFLADVNNIKNLNATFKDDESGIQGVKYLLIDGNSRHIIKDFTSTTIIPGSLEDGKTYSIKFIGKNNSGKTFEKLWSTFVYDSSAPTNLQLDMNMDRGSFIKGESVSFDLSVNEDDSPIVVSELKIGTEQDDVSVSKNITGNNNGVIKLLSGWSLNEDNLQKNRYSINLPDDIDNGSYKVSLICENGSKKSVSVSKNLIIDNDVEVLVVGAPSIYTPFNNMLKATWRYNNPTADVEIENVSYKIQGLLDSVDLNDLSKNELFITLPEGKTLTTGVGYIVEVTLSLSNGEKITETSPAIYLDNTAPELDEEGLDIYPSFSESEGLYTNWKVIDSISDIASINLKVEKQVKGKWEVATDNEWINVNGFKNEDTYNFSNISRKVQQESETGEILEIDEKLKTGDRVRITRQFVNGAGLPLTDTSSVIIIDDTPPKKPIVTNTMSYINPVYIADGKETQRPNAHWKFSEGDLESGVTYSWAFVNNIIDIENNENITWNEGEPNKKAEISTEDFTFNKELHGETWYFVVKAVNGLGKTMFGHCSGISFDTTAPVIASVKLLEEKEGKKTEAYYITSKSGLNLYINASDDVSNNSLLYSASYGKRDEKGDYSKTKDISKNSVENILSINSINPPAGDIITFRGEVINGAKIAETGFSSAIKVDVNSAKLENVVGYVNNKKLNYSWDIKVGDSPIAYYEYKLLNGETVLDNWVQIDTRSISFQTDPNGKYKDGNYTFKVRAVSDSGRVSEVAESNKLYVDNSAPQITKLGIDNYIFESFKADVTTQDPSGIEAYKYTLGTFSEPESLSGGWVTGKASSSIFKIEIDLSDKIIVDGETLYFSIMVMDRAGNWSELKSSSGISVDKTSAVVSNVTIPRYSKYRNKIENITLDAKDLQSGLTKITFIIHDNGTSRDIYTKDLIVSDNTYSLSEYSLELGKNLLNNDSNYTLKIKATNGTGEECLEVESQGFVTVDSVIPSLVFDKKDEEIVVNECNAENKFDIGYTLSEKCKVILSLERPDGTNIAETIENHESGDYNYGYFHNYQTDNEAYGKYILRAVIVDRAGNENTSEQSIRFNKPPYVSVYTMITNPGRPFNLKPFEVKDTDTPLTYEWTITDHGPTSDTVTLTGTDLDKSNLTYEFLHSELKSPKSAYFVRLKVTDKYNKSTIINYAGKSDNPTTDPLILIVENTSEGPLYVDEYWSLFGDETSHIIGGDIIVGDKEVNETATLTILPNTTIKVHGNSDVGYNHEIIVNSEIKTESLITANSNTEPNIRFIMNPLIAELWKGIRINPSGKATLRNTEIRDARRGIAAIGNGSNVVLNNCLINNNITGVHAFNSNPFIIDSIISNNSAYGIKEDEASEPATTGTKMENNTIDFYDSVNTYNSGENK